MNFSSRLWFLMFAGSLGLGGCAVVPVDEYGYRNDDYGYYERDTVIVTPPPRVEYRGRPPVSSYIWIDGYWNWVGHRHDWVSGYWAPPGTRPRAIVQHRHFERDRDDDRRARGWRDGREERRDHDGERRREIRDRDGVRDRDARRERSDDRERAVVREREQRIDRNQVQPGIVTRPQFTPRARIQAESERRRLDSKDAREERRTIRRDEAGSADRSGDQRHRHDGERTGPGERRSDERGRPDWRERMREAGAN